MSNRIVLNGVSYHGAGSIAEIGPVLQAKGFQKAFVCSDQDLVKFGLIPEFVGRLPIIVTLDNLDEDALVRILTEPRNALVKQYAKLLELDGVSLSFDQDALTAIAHMAMQQKSGARGLRSVVEELLIPIMYDIPSDATITKVTIDADTVEGGQPHIEHGAMRPRYKSLTEQQ